MHVRIQVKLVPHSWAVVEHLNRLSTRGCLEFERNDVAQWIRNRHDCPSNAAQQRQECGAVCIQLGHGSLINRRNVPLFQIIFSIQFVHHDTQVSNFLHQPGLVVSKFNAI